ncbi:MAG: aldehyde dehydrogenase family protein, partial [Saprospiraceae bacterium]|nr:aldehyde dehydrogenase family protein [Saprospiraceae bacterium]
AKLRRLNDCLLRRRAEVEAALWADFRKNATEVNISELGVVLHEIRYAIRHLQSWMHTKKVGTPLTLFGASSEIVYEPKGVCLILSPWNFPFNLTFTPLVSAIAAGNCVILKPSEYAPHSSALMLQIVAECFPPGEVSLFEGDATVAQELLTLPFNHIFFTGSPQVGKIVMRAAAEHLASITLELGGKSPVIVEDAAELDNAAAKIAFLKLLNASQTCIAPDYVLVNERLHDALVEKLSAKIKQYFGKTAAEIQQSPDYCRLIHPRHFARVKALLDDALHRGATLEAGGETDENDLFIAPTLLTRVPEEAKIWEEEIFGPLLPIRTYQSLDQAIAYINQHPKALAMYIFSRDSAVVNRVIAQTRCGGVAINDCGIQFYNSELPFGGSNNSGIGQCHGEFGFLEFSHQRSVMRQTRLFPTTDFFLPPYGGTLRKWLLEAVVKWL